MSVPFADLGEAAICARVAIAYLKLIRKQYNDHEVQPLILIGITVQSLAGLKFVTLRSALLSLAVWVGDHRQSSAWLTGVIYRDMMGYSLRRCYLAEYKGTRRDPRVTNRGVIPPLQLPALPLEGFIGAHEMPVIADD